MVCLEQAPPAKTRDQVDQRPARLGLLTQGPERQRQFLDGTGVRPPPQLQRTRRAAARHRPIRPPARPGGVCWGISQHRVKVGEQHALQLGCDTSSVGVGRPHALSARPDDVAQCEWLTMPCLARTWLVGWRPSSPPQHRCDGRVVGQSRRLAASRNPDFLTPQGCRCAAVRRPILGNAPLKGLCLSPPAGKPPGRWGGGGGGNGSRASGQ